jgi:hypothetical protein
MKNLLFIFLLFQLSTLAQTLNKNYVFDELLRDPDRQPKVMDNFSALKTEEIRKSTLIETENIKRLFLGTGTHGYLWEIKITNSLANNDSQPIINHGKVFTDKNANTKIRALVNDGRFIYGATSETPSLFFFDTKNNKIYNIKSLKDILKKESIWGFYSAAIYEDGHNKYIFFATDKKPNGKLKIVRWKVIDTPTVNDKIDFIDLNIVDNFVASITITKLNGEPVIVAGFSNKSELKILRRITSPNPLVESINLSSKGWKTSNIVGSIYSPGIVWLFNNGGKPDEFLSFVKYSLENKECKVIRTSRTSGNQFCNYYYQHNVGGEDYIFTQQYRVSVKSDKVQYYSSDISFKERTSKLRGQSIVGTSNGNYVVSFAGWANSDRKLDFINTHTLKGASNKKYLHTDNNFVFQNVSRQVISLGVLNKTVFMSWAGYGNELILEDANPKSHWLINPLRSGKTIGTSVSKIYSYNYDNIWKTYYSIYDNPFLTVKTPRNSIKRFEPFVILQKVINDPRQKFARTIKAVNNYLFLGTEPYWDEIKSTRGSLLVYDLASRNLKLVGKLNNNSGKMIHSIDAVIHPDFPKSKILIYGATGNGTFVYTFEKNQDSPKPMSYNTSVPATSVLVVEDDLYILTTGKGQIIKYAGLPRRTKDLNKRPKEKIDLQCNTSGGELILGNDGYLYAAYHDNRPPNKSWLKKIKIRGEFKLVEDIYYYESSESDWQIISAIAIDASDKSNIAIYVGFRGADVKKIYQNSKKYEIKY